MWLQNLDSRFLFVLAGAGGALAAGAYFAFRRRPSPDEIERRRRLAVNRHRRHLEGEIVEVDESTIQYAYNFRGVEYSASQDVRSLVSLLPPNLPLLIGRQVTVKFDPGNPANSIVLCEEWSGLPNPPVPPPQAGSPDRRLSHSN
jgi:hypothetical protein